MNRSTCFLATFVLSMCILPGLMAGDETRLATTLPPVISSNMTLDAAGSPYTADGDVTLDRNVTLTISGGAVIEMPQGATLHIRGELKVNGSSGSKVTFTRAAGATSWGAICVNEATAPAVIRHAIVEYATDALSFTDTCAAAVSARSTNLTVDNVEFGHNKISILTDSAVDVLVTNSVFLATNINEHINLKESDGSIVVQNSEFFKQGDGDSIDYDTVSQGVIRNNVIHGSPDDCIDLGQGTKAVLLDNVINDCFDKGVSVGTDRGNIVYAEGNVLMNIGKAFFVSDSAFVTLERNTMYNNGNHLQTSASGKITARNMIFAGSGAIAPAGGSDLRLTYSLFSGSAWSGTGNISGNPNFVNASAGNFNIQASSPAVDAGDPNSTLDADGTVADMGAFPRNQGGSVKTVVINEINFESSSQFNSGDWIELHNPGTSSVSLSGLKLENGSGQSFNLSGSISAKGFIVVAENQGSFSSVHPGVNSIGSFGSTFTLGTSEILKITDGSGKQIDNVHYNNGPLWPPSGANGTGATLSMFSELADNGFGHNWIIGPVKGTPGKSNGVPPDDPPPPSNVKKLVINEIYYSESSGSGDPGDWIEILSRESSTVNLSNYKFGAGGSTWTIPSGTSIGAGQYLILAKNASNFQAKFPSVSNVKGNFNFDLSSSGAALSLRDDQSRTVDQVTYDDNSPWPTQAKSSGRTLELKSATSDNSQASNWQASKDPDGTPARSNSSGYTQPPTPFVSLLITEIKYANGPSPDSDDWVEIYNPQDSTVNISSWKLRDSSDSWTIPSGTSIGAGQYLVLARNGSSFSNKHGDVTNVKSSFNFDLSSSGGQVKLVDALSRDVDVVNYDDSNPWPPEARQDGRSLELKSLSSDNSQGSNWQASKDPAGTPGKSNSSGFVPISAIPMVISEINYQSSSSFDSGDWLEVYNPQSSTVDMSNWKIKAGSDSWTIPSGTTVGAGQFVVLFQNQSKFNARHASVSNKAGSFSFDLGRSENLVLEDNGGNQIDQVQYSSNSPWPQEANGNGWTMELKDVSLSTNNNQASAWQGSANIGGSPGAANSAGYSPDPIIFSEINHTGKSGFDPGDWVEIYNPGNAEVDLTGWTFTRGSSSWDIPNGTKLGARAFLVLAKQKQTFSNIHSTVGNVVGSFNFELEGDATIKMIDPFGNEVDEVSYQNSAPWPSDANGSGKTIELTSLALGFDNSVGANWMSSALSGGTPGRGDSDTGSVATLLISEINHTSPNDLRSGDWFELYNPGSSGVALKGLIVSGSGSNDRWTIPGNAPTLGAGQYIVVSRNQSDFARQYPRVSSPIGNLSFNLNPTGRIAISDAVGNVIDEVDYGNQDPWASEANGRGPTLEIISVDTSIDNNEGSSWQASMYGGSPGAASGPALVRPSERRLVINEISYRQSNSDDHGDWVEIYNTTQSPINLSYWRLETDQDGERFTFPTGTVIAASGYLVLSPDTAAFVSRGGANRNEINLLGELGFELPNATRNIMLYDAGLATVDSVRYGTSGAWPSTESAAGSSIELENPDRNNEMGENWSLSTAPKGTPGFQNSAFAVGTENGELAEGGFQVLEPYPNPFTTRATLPYRLGSAGDVEVTVSNTLGQTIAHLFAGQQGAGEHNVLWDAEGLGAGIYFVRIKVDQETTATRKVILVR